MLNKDTSDRAAETPTPVCRKKNLMTTMSSRSFTTSLQTLDHNAILHCKNWCALHTTIGVISHLPVRAQLTLSQNHNFMHLIFIYYDILCGYFF